MFQLAVRTALARRAVIYQLPVGARFTHHTVLFPLPVGAGVARRADAFPLTVRAEVAHRTVVFDLAVGAGGAHRAHVFLLAVRATGALPAVLFHLPVRVGVARCAVLFQLPVGTRVTLLALVFLPSVQAPLPFPCHQARSVVACRAPRSVLEHARTTVVALKVTLGRGERRLQASKSPSKCITERQVSRSFLQSAREIFLKNSQAKTDETRQTLFSACHRLLFNNHPPAR